MEYARVKHTNKASCLKDKYSPPILNSFYLEFSVNFFYQKQYSSTTQNKNNEYSENFSIESKIMTSLI